MQTAMGCSYVILTNTKIIHEVEFKMHRSCLVITMVIYSHEENWPKPVL